MARTELYEDSCGALLKSARAAEFRTAWNMTNQWRNQQLRRSHVMGESISQLPEIKIRKKKKDRRKSEREKDGRKEKQKNKIKSKRGKGNKEDYERC